jgi:mono/diheme cytochrome c family protein
MTRRADRSGSTRGAAALLAVAAVAGVAAMAARADDASGKVGAGTTLIEAAKLVDGKDIYSHICQGCHMPEAQGAVGAGHYPKLAGDPALVSWEYVAITVLNGKGGMPAFGQKPGSVPAIFAANLSDAQVAEIVNYVRSHFGNRYKAGVTAQQVAGLPHPRGTNEE